MFQSHTFITHKKPTLQSELCSKAIPSGQKGNEIVFSADVIVSEVLNVFN